MAVTKYKVIKKNLEAVINYAMALFVFIWKVTC